MYVYFLILNDYGIRPNTLWGLAEQLGDIPNANDVYNAAQSEVQDCNGSICSLYGNTNVLVESATQAEKDDMWTRMGWDKETHGRYDVRLWYARSRSADSWTSCRWPTDDEDYPKFYRYSGNTDYPICYSTEALKYAQSGYLCSIVCVQWADLLICKTRNLSISQQGLWNSFGNFGLFSETALVAILCYTPPLNVALQTRGIAFPHFIAPSFSFYTMIFFYDELRKIYLRNGMVRENNKLRLRGWVVQNTYY